MKQQVMEQLNQHKQSTSRSRTSKITMTFPLGSRENCAPHPQNHSCNQPEQATNALLSLVVSRNAEINIAHRRISVTEGNSGMFPIADSLMDCTRIKPLNTRWLISNNPLYKSLQSKEKYLMISPWISQDEKTWLTE